MGSQQLYQYPQLEGEDAIRLVVIQPSADLTAPIRCSIIQTLLLECEDDIADHYVALSYVWGDQTNRRSVEVDGKAALDITASLDEALRHIRNHHKCLRIWADGVCINQNDVEERNKQVRRMGRIYENAAHTIIFLGLATRETELLFDISKSLRPPGPNTHDREFLSLFGNLSDSDHTSIVKDIVGRPWFGRIWVLQELVFSLNPWVQCGTSRIKWQRLCAHLINPVPHIHSIMDETLRSLSDMNEARNQFKISRAIPSAHSYARFFDLIISRRGLGASDPRDLIYAHLGMTDAHTQNAFVIDYKKPCSDLFEDVAIQFIRSSKNLSILEHVGDIGLVNRRPGLPSWVPDWTTPLLSEGLKKPPSFQVDRYDSVSVSHVLPHVLGFIADTYWIVDTVEPRLEKRRVRLKKTKTQMDINSETYAKSCVSQGDEPRDINRDRNDEDVSSVMTRFGHCMLGIVNRLRPVENNLVNYVKQALNFIPKASSPSLLKSTDESAASQIANFSSLRTTSQFLMPQLSRGSTDLFWNPDESIHAKMARYIPKKVPFDALRRASVAYLEGQTIALLEQGDITVVPHSTRAGDIVCQFFRGPLPQYVVLRPVDNTFDPETEEFLLKDLQKMACALQSKDSVCHVEFVSVMPFNRDQTLGWCRWPQRFHPGGGAFALH